MRGRRDRFGQRVQHGFRIEAQQARVVAHEAADESAAGKRGKITLLERRHLARSQLQLLRDCGDGQSGGLAARAQELASGQRGVRLRILDQRLGAFRHSQAPVAMNLASAESGYRLRSCEI